MVSLGERTGWIGSAVSEGNPRGGVTQQTWSELAEKQSIQIWQNLTLSKGWWHKRRTKMTL